MDPPPLASPRAVSEVNPQNMQTELEKQRNLVRHYKTQWKEAAKVVELVDKKNSELVEVRRELAVAHAEVESKKREIKRLHAQVEQMLGSTDPMQDKLTTLERKFKEACDARDQMQLELAASKTLVIQLRTHSQQLEEQVNAKTMKSAASIEMQERMKDLERRLGEKSRELAKERGMSSKTVAQMQLDIDRLTTEKQQLELEKNTNSSLAEHEREWKLKLLDQRSTFEARIQDLEMQLRTSRCSSSATDSAVDNVRLKQQLIDAQRALKASQQLVMTKQAHFESRLKDMEAELTLTQQQLQQQKSNTSPAKVVSQPRPRVKELEAELKSTQQRLRESERSLHQAVQQTQHLARTQAQVQAHLQAAAAASAGLPAALISALPQLPSVKRFDSQRTPASPSDSLRSTPPVIFSQCASTAASMTTGLSPDSISSQEPTIHTSRPHTRVTNLDICEDSDSSAVSSSEEEEEEEEDEESGPECDGNVGKEKDNHVDAEVGVHEDDCKVGGNDDRDDDDDADADADAEAEDDFLQAFMTNAQQTPKLHVTSTAKSNPDSKGQLSRPSPTSTPTSCSAISGSRRKTAPVTKEFVTLNDDDEIRNQPPETPSTIVSTAPRSGTSIMKRILKGQSIGCKRKRDSTDSLVAKKSKLKPSTDMLLASDGHMLSLTSPSTSTPTLITNDTVPASQSTDCANNLVLNKAAPEIAPATTLELDLDCSESDSESESDEEMASVWNGSACMEYYWKRSKPAGEISVTAEMPESDLLQEVKLLMATIAVPREEMARLEGVPRNLCEQTLKALVAQTVSVQDAAKGLQSWLEIFKCSKLIDDVLTERTSEASLNRSADLTPEKRISAFLLLVNHLQPELVDTMLSTLMSVVLYNLKAVYKWQPADVQRNVNLVQLFGALCRRTRAVARLNVLVTDMYLMYSMPPPAINQLVQSLTAVWPNALSAETQKHVSPLWTVAVCSILTSLPLGAANLEQTVLDTLDELHQKSVLCPPATSLEDSLAFQYTTSILLAARSLESTWICNELIGSRLRPLLEPLLQGNTLFDITVSVDAIAACIILLSDLLVFCFQRQDYFVCFEELKTAREFFDLKASDLKRLPSRVQTAFTRSAITLSFGMKPYLEVIHSWSQNM